MFRATAKPPSLTEALKTVQIVESMRRMKALTSAATALKDELRQQTVAAGFTSDFAKSWQLDLYPPAGKTSLHPASVVKSHAPKVIDAYARGATIVATGGRRLLAIPTEDTPLKSAGGPKRTARAKTPAEVEAQYGRKLRFVPARSAQGSQLGSGRATGYLVMDNLVARKATGRFRSASDREITGTSRNKGRLVRSVVMFILVSQVRVPKRIDLQGALDRAGTTLEQLLRLDEGS